MHAIAASGTETRPSTVRGEELRVAYRGKTVLDIESISVPAGKTFALLGASGAGKSTLLRILGLLEGPTSGRVFFDGKPANRGSLATRRTIAAVFQKPYLLRGTVAHNVGYGLRLRHLRSSECKASIAEALARVGLSGWEGRSALTLSGGEAQRVALARALVLRPRLLLLDEPLSYMDPLLKRQLSLEFAAILADEGMTALYVTHDRDEAAVVADRIAVMREGRIVADGEPDTVLTLPTDPWVAAFLGTGMPLDGVVASSNEGIAQVDCSGVGITTTSVLPRGARVRLGVRPEDVLLFEPDVPLPKSPDRNRLLGTIVEISPSGVTVSTLVDVGGVAISSAVSRSTAESLALKVGTPVAAVFRADAVRVSEIT
jgi:molybdopterin-binding protein